MFDHSLALKNWLKWPFQNLPESWKNGEKGDVILIPGFLSTWNFLTTIGNFTNSLGFRVHVIKNIDINVYPIVFCLDQLREYLEKNNLEKVILIGHSKGALMARLALKNPKIDKRIVKVITLAAPFGGSLRAKKFQRFFNLHELSPDSVFIKQAQKVSRKESSKIINLYSKIDNTVKPKTSLVLKGIENSEVDVSGHNRILESPKTLIILRQILKTKS